MAQITARDAKPGTKIVIDSGRHFFTAYVRAWTPAPGEYANLVASDTPNGRAWYRGQYAADHLFDLA